MLASRGLRDMDDGVQKIADAEERKQVLRQANKVWGQSALVAAAATAAVVLILRMYRE